MYDGSVTTYNATTWTRVHRHKEHKQSEVLSIAFSPNNRHLAFGSVDWTCRLWDTVSGETLFVMRGHTYCVRSVAFSPCGKQIASASQDGTIRLWSSETGVCLFVLRGHKNTVFSATYSSDGQRLVSGSNDGTIRVWDPKAGAPEGRILDDDAGRLTSIAFSPIGEFIVSSSEDKTVRLWDSSNGHLISRLSGHRSEITTCIFSPDGLQIASGDKEGVIRLWEVNTNRSGSLIQHLAAKVRTVAYSPDDGQRLILGTGASSVMLWDLQSHKPDVKLEGHTDAVYSVAYSPCGKLILSGSGDKTARLWSGEVDSWSCVAVVSGCLEAVTSVAWNPAVPMEFVTGSGDGSVRVWRISGTKAGGMSVRMQWGSCIGRLCAVDLIFKGAIGLNPISQRLLIQRGAIDDLLPLEEIDGLNEEEIEAAVA
ncbi:WD40 repeat-like protein [Linnemannia elongata AG-77]|uniref:WD40 repeat-like protein n=1 Tax=Linnemannia elongata AG-77 TaxID=1314771 RepID=A0A197K6D4_9FUNG|nr:WD40 repeat-like protein [Linnemannia elongata AG-77]